MNIYSLISFFSFTLSIYLGIYVLRLNPKATLNRLFFIITLLVGSWDFGYVFIYPETDKETLFFWYKVTAIGWTTFASFLVHFMFYLTKKQKYTKSPFVIALVYFPALIFLIKALSGGFIAIDFEVRNNIAYEVQDKTNIWYYAYIIYIWSYLIFSIVHLKIHSRKSSNRKIKIQANILSYTVIFLIVFSSLTNLIFPIINYRTVPPIAQILISLFMFAIWYSIVKYKFLALSAETAANEIIAEMKELLFFIDENAEVIKVNKFTIETLGINIEKIKGKSIKDLFDKSEKLNYLLNTNNSDDSSSFDMILKTQKNGKIPVNVSYSKIKDSLGDNIGSIIVGRDIRDKIQITNSINYAKLIQQSIFSSIKNLQNIIPESFIFFKPRDIVSGDFYWFKVTDRFIFIAVVDCTGHGVPGAFMSIIGSNLLNEIIIQKNIVLPSDILLKLDEGVKNSLSNKSADEKLQDDGMEISLCRIDKKFNKITVSSSNQSSFMIIQNEIIELPGSLHSIGGMITKNKVFDNHEYEIIPNSLLYLFSDGFQDQFGGERVKKYSSLKFTTFIQSIHSKPMTEQCLLIENEFEQWKGTNKQIDDVTVMGIRL